MIIDREKFENKLVNYVNKNFSNNLYFSNDDIEIIEITNNKNIFDLNKINNKYNHKQICKYCFKYFTTYQSCNRHQNHYCKQKNNSDIQLSTVHNYKKLTLN